VAVVILAGILNLFSFQEHWLNYRVTCEKLRREARFVTGARRRLHKCSGPAADICWKSWINNSQRECILAGFCQKTGVRDPLRRPGRAWGARTTSISKSWELTTSELGVKTRCTLAV